ncbi:unnamed protein product [Paramecium sonneborni]|uniref:Rab-GAP TBC domain-containing protein n=1 Tax=Paramecium sonneborni TaxID=65129 RepID=A0A8S1KD79_9CILI|nr:unnamed protein product [Paramecium sonneborni]
MKRTQCNCDENIKKDFDNCSQSLEWLVIHYDIKQLDNMRKDYQLLCNIEIADQQQWITKQRKQIERDLMRTFPNEPFFQSKHGKEALQRLLFTIAIYDIGVGFVQGMNFLAGALLFHSEECVAFWNYVTLYERLQLRDIYLENLPGLSKHIQIIQLLCMSQQRKLYDMFLKNNVQFENFCIPWFLSMLAMVIPIRSFVRILSNQNLVIKPMILSRWIFVYKLILSFLQNLELICEGPELLMELTSKTYKWNHCIPLANNLNLDKKFIDLMLESFDQDKQTFLIKLYNGN